MSLSAHATRIDMVMVNIALLVIGLVTLLAFQLSETIDRIMGANAMKVMTRLMGLILAVIGVEMFVAGIKKMPGVSEEALWQESAQTIALKA